MKLVTSPNSASGTADPMLSMDRPIGRRILSRQLVGAATGLVVAALALGWWLLIPAQTTLRVRADRLIVSTVVKAPFHDFIPLRGQVLPLDSIVLDVSQGGRVEEVMAEAGQRVTAGQPLLRFSDPSLELDAIARETQVIEQMNTQRQLQLEFEQSRTGDAHALAEADYNITRLARQVARRAPLASQGFESQENMDQSADELAYQKHLRDIAADAQKRDGALIDNSEGLIRETAGRLQDNLAAAKRMLDALTLRAPADGVLTAFDAHVGEEKTKGMRLGQLDQDGGFKVTVPVDEFYLARVRSGQHVDVTVDGKPTGLVVSKVYPEVRDGKFNIELAWTTGSAPADLRRGQMVQGDLELGGDKPSLILPSGAFLSVSGGAWVFVVDGAETAHRRTVKLGRRTPDSVEVLSGLAAGDRVVTSDYAGLEQIERLDITQ